MTRWRTLAHRGPLFPPVAPPDARGDGEQGGTCAARLARLDVPREGKVAVSRMRQMVERAKAKGVGEREQEAFLRRFWQSWSQQYLPAACGLMTPPDPALIQRLAVAGAQVVVADRRTSKDTAARQAGYDTACVDGRELPIANFRVEAPGVFAGRGVGHPFAGRVKRLLRSSNVTINLGKAAKVHAPSDGGEWAGVVHDRDASWLASWRDPATGKTKYMRLLDRSNEDVEKFNLAGRVARALPAARIRVSARIASAVQQSPQHAMSHQTLQNACCLLLIDRFALRVGGDSGGGRVFGATTLRPEHVRLTPPGSIALSFLGKDSILCVAEGGVSRELYDGMTALGRGLFKGTDDKSLNRFIAGKEVLGPGATAKTVRTARACETYEAVLKQHVLQHAPGEEWRSVAIERLAVVAVAMLCNHRRGDVIGDPLRERMTLNAAMRVVAVATRKKTREAIKMAVEGLNLSTAPGNYLDPRITRAYEARLGLPGGTCSTPTNRRKFAWADGTSGSWSFKRGS